MKRSYILVASTLIMAAAAATSLTQCSGGGGNPDGGDGGPVGDAKPPKDVMTGDATGDAGDAGPVVVPAGMELAGGDAIRIWGVTDDGVIVFSDTVMGGKYAGGLYTVPVAGGTPAKLATPQGSYFAATAGRVVVVWDNLSTNGVGKMHTWTQGGAYANFAALSVAANGAASSLDGNYIIFEANSNPAATVADIVGAKIDGSGQTTLASQVDVGPGNFTTFVNGCVPTFGFPNTTTALVVSCATNPGDAGAANGVVNSFAIATDGGAWASTPIVPADGLPTFSWDGDGGNATTVFTATDTTNLEQVTPVGGGVSTTVDTKNVDKGDWTFIYINRAGTNVFYNSGSTLYTATTGAVPVVGTVQATGVNYVRAVSNDEKWMIYTTTWDMGAPPPTSFGSDLYLTSAMAGAGAPVQLGTGTTNALFGLNGADQFTSDSSHVLWVENVNTTAGTGDFYSMALPTGTPTKIATGQWQNWSATGTKVVYEDNCPLCSASGKAGLAYADIEVVDVSQSTPMPTKVQAGADVQLGSGLYALYMSPAKDHIIYTYSQDPPTMGMPGGNGLYVVAVP